MKKTVVLFILATLVSLNTKADQLAWLSKENAMKATSYLRNQTNVILWCACCEGNNPKQLVTITNVYYEKTGTEDYYHIMLEGQSNSNKTINEELDLAYVHVNKDGMAVCLGRELGLECDPCTNPFVYTSSNLSSNNTRPTLNGTYADWNGNQIILEEIKGEEKIKYKLSSGIVPKCFNTPGFNTAVIFKGLDPNKSDITWYVDILNRQDGCNVYLQIMTYGKSVKVVVKNCNDSECSLGGGTEIIFNKD